MNDVQKFLLDAAVMALAVVAVVFFLNALYEHSVLPQKNTYNVFQQYETAKNEQLQIIIFGDSQASNAANPQYFSANTFNYAIPSETYEQTYYKVRTVLAENTTASVFVFPFDIMSFADYRTNVYYDMWYWDTYMTTQELAAATGRSPGQILVQSKVPVTGKGFELRRLFINMKSTTILRGWQHNEGDFSQHPDRQGDALLRAKQQVKGNAYLFAEKPAQYFSEVVNLSLQHNKTVVVVKYPLTEEYIAALYALGVDREAYYTEVNALLAPYPQVIVLDYQEYLAQNTSLFANPNHLNDNGAALFSRQLAGELEPLLE